MRHASPMVLAALLAASLLPGALAQTAAPAPAPAKATAATVSPVTDRTVSGVAIAVSRAVGGQLVSCPSKLKVGRQAVCLYSKQAAAQARAQVRTALGSQALGDWKISGQTTGGQTGAQSGSLLVKDTAGKAGAYVLSAPLSANETLLIVDAVSVPAARPAAPAGVVKGQPYLLGKDLLGVVNVVSLGGGKYRLNVAGETPLTVTAGQRTAQRGSGNVDLPLAPASDGKNLIFPLSGLRALGCTVSDAPKGVTVDCGGDSVGVLPIVF